MVSIIVPIYKVEQYLTRCVDSLCAQTNTDIEVILVNDGSPDNCGKMCDLYAQKDKRIRVIHKVNGGLSDARNTGVKSALGEYVSFVDSDDFIHPEFMEALVSACENKDCDIAQCGVLWVYSDGEMKDQGTGSIPAECSTVRLVVATALLSTVWENEKICEYGAMKGSISDGQISMLLSASVFDEPWMRSNCGYGK